MSEKLDEAVRDLTGVTGELRGELSGFRTTLANMNKVCSIHGTSIRKNTNFRHYCKGVIGTVLIFCGYLAYQVEGIKSTLKTFFGAD